MTSHQVQLLFVDVALILLLARWLGHLTARLQQPPVVGEILAGVLLGPSLLNGAVSDTLFPADIRPLLSGLANIGVALFMFGVGLELEGSILRGRGRAVSGAALGSTLIPFALGVGTAFYLLRTHETRNNAAFVVFIGLSVSVTAFPVLARILTDRGLGRTALGGVALATAAAVDVVAWVALAGVQAAVGGGEQHWRVALTVPYLVVMVLAVRPALHRLLVPGGTAAPFAPWNFAVVLIGALLSAAATEAMGMHFIFGAFLFGVIMPRKGAEALLADIRDRTGQVTSLLLPAYFVVAGLKVDLGGLGSGDLLDLGLILLVAVAGKFGGTYLGARSHGLPPRPASALAALMNTRGLTELVILGVGLQLGLLDGSLYSLMVVMAVVTTVMTGPLLSRIYRRPVEVPRSTRIGIPDSESAAARSAQESIPAGERGR
ncbi:cation:proton antiporter domain-containing protein [Peterkaempfera bronchialis]|uniref:Cation/H(+) antiporter n=1 Tax=Peterkaempfera bronchialis TaxID=2126346 RepID=A0A345T2A2_9ACTN|nr:cation:proton antiporter [Peterkaempfera bronchialis]AXI80107.1 cation/H(+) antiporter [Peterkaempfera bronchialis]